MLSFTVHVFGQTGVSKQCRPKWDTANSDNSNYWLNQTRLLIIFVVLLYISFTFQLLLSQTTVIARGKSWSLGIWHNESAVYYYYYYYYYYYNYSTTNDCIGCLIDQHSVQLNTKSVMLFTITLNVSLLWLLYPRWKVWFRLDCQSNSWKLLDQISRSLGLSAKQRKWIRHIAL